MKLKTLLENEATNKHIKISYQVVDEEGAEHGDFKETGWEDEEGVSMEPDEFDKEEGKTAVDNAVEFLLDKGATESSSSHHTGGGTVWYTSESEPNYETGEHTSYSYHLYGFSDEEEKEIFDRISKQTRTI